MHMAFVVFVCFASMTIMKLLATERIPGHHGGQERKKGAIST